MWRRSVSDPVPSVLKQTLTVAAILSVISLLLEPDGLVEKSVIVVVFAVAAALASARRVQVAASLSVVGVTIASASLSHRLGATPHGMLQLTALLLTPFVAVLATLGDSRVTMLGGLASLAATQAVAMAWGLGLQEHLLLGFTVSMGTLLSVAVAVVLAESKRQAVHDMRATRRKEARLRLSEDQRASAERMAFAAHLAAKLSHELNNPLAFSLANLRFVSDAVKDASVRPDEVRSAVEEAHEGLDRIRRIVDRMSLFHASQAQQTADVATALRALVDDRLSRATQATLTLELGATPIPAIALDPARFTRVAGSVLDNAFEAVATLVGHHHITVRVKVGANAVSVVTEDDGPGLPPEFHTRLLAANVAMSGKLGLGLPLARELLRSIGGDLIAENRPEGGARVTLVIPPASASASDPPRPPSRPPRAERDSGL